MRIAGPVSAPNASSATIETISAPQPHSRGFSSTVNSRPVLVTSARIVRVSSGTSDRTSMTVASMPSSADSFSAAASARGTIAASARIVASPPWRSTLARPSSSVISPSGTSPLLGYRPLCSKNRTGSGSRTAAASSPMTSRGFDGATTFRPGTAIAQFSTDCECWAPKRSPAPLAQRTTSGSASWPSDMYLILAISLAIRSQQTAKKSLNMISAIGRRPVIAAPTAAPRMACSLIGVSRTRSGPNCSSKPGVVLNTPPAAATSSPRKTTLGSRLISWAIPRVTASR
jgi:hypothetical protein